MASYTHQEVHHIRHEWRVPGALYGGWGAAIAEVHKAIAAAEIAYEKTFARKPTGDDWLRVWAGDEDVVLFFEQKVSDR